MKSIRKPRIPSALAAALAFSAFTAGPIHAATLSVSPTPPPVNGHDIANLGTVTGNDKWWAENSTGAGSAKGQTFTTGTTALPGVDTAIDGLRSVTWTKAAAYAGVYPIDFVVETSADLTGPWTAETHAPSGMVTVTGNQVKFTFPSPLGSRRFARLKVTGP